MRVSDIGTCLCTTLSLAVSAQADVLDVGGPTPDHAQISSAVGAARDGDVIRIWPGNYQPFTVLGKSLALVEATSSGAVLVGGTIRIRELGPEQSVVLSGIDATGTDGRGLVVSDCLGAVRIRDGAYRGGPGSGFGAPADGHAGALITGCSDVELTECALRSGNPESGGEYAGAGGPGLELDSSTLSAFRSQFQGASGGFEDDPGASGAPGGHGIHATGDCSAYVSGCTLTGGNGGSADFDADPWTYEYGYGGDGGYGFYATGGVHWFLATVFQPGTGGSSPAPGQQGSPGQATTGGTMLPGVSRHVRATARLDDASDIALRFEGAVGDEVYLRVASEPDYQFSPTLGPVLVAAPPVTPFGASGPWVASQGWRFIGTIDASGVLLSTLPARELPDLGHDVLHLQAGYEGARTYLGSSSWSVVLDTGW